MKKASIVICLVVLGAGLLLARAIGAQQSLNFSSVDFPAAATTTAFGINSEGDIVGGYKDAQGAHHGFLLRRGTFTSIDYPGAISTDARGINPDGDIVGSYTNSPGGPPNIHGYLLRNGEFSEVQVPGHLGTIAQRISPEGTIVGCLHDTDTMRTMHGFVLQNGAYSANPVPFTMNNGITPGGGKVVGLENDATSGYLLENGTVASRIQFPNSAFTDAWDINASGEIVGEYQDQSANPTIHGFFLKGDNYVSIDFPGASLTWAFGVSDRGEIVGFYLDSSGHQHAFLLRSGG